MRDRAEGAVLEVASSMTAQNQAALNAVEESHRMVVENLLLQLDAGRFETTRIRETGAATEKALRQRIAEREDAVDALKPKH